MKTILGSLIDLAVVGVLLWAVITLGTKLRTSTEEIEVIRAGFQALQVTVCLCLAILIIRMDFLFKKD